MPRARSVEEEQSAADGRLEPILARLKGSDAEAREIAADELEELARHGMAVAEALELLERAVDRFPARRFDIQDTASDLIRAAGQVEDAALVPAVVRNYRRYHPKARVAALELLAERQDRAAAEAIISLFRSNANSGRVRAFPVAALIEAPRHPDVFFPEMLSWLEVPDLTWPICELCLGWVDQGVISATEISAHVARILQVYAPRRDRLLELEGRSDRDEEAYGLLRREAGLLLDLLGHVPTPGVQAELRRALAFQDVRVKFFAVISLLRLGRTVLAEDIEQIAASAEMRRWLWDALERQDQSHHFPYKWRNPEAFAESDLVRWLAWPAEVGRVPDDIELMQTVSIEPAPNVILEWYVFRFRISEPHWASREGWIAGVVGPYLQGASSGTPALGDAFSRFEAYSRRTAEGHVGDLDSLMLDWQERLEAISRR